MNSLWMSLKENGNCRSKIIHDVICHPKKYSKDKLKNSSNETLIDSNSTKNKVGGGGGGGRRNPFGEVTIRRNHSRKRYNLGWENLDVFLRRQNARTQFFELNKGDHETNVIEMIYRRALPTNPTKPFREIKMVLKVKNSVEVLEKFENYRESVKISAYEQRKKHPRSIVDGNEVLRFYSTTMSCCSGISKRVSELCRNPSCRVCRIIQSNFNTEYTKETGIRLSTSSEDFCNNGGGVAFSERRAVIVCRMIAGMVGDKVDEKYEGQNCNSESLIVWNPCAVLPCFVIVVSPSLYMCI